MSSTPPEDRKPARNKGVSRPVTLKTVADHLGLSPATVSLVLNHAPGARTIPKATKDRVFAAAKQLNYRANHMARSLRTQRSFTIGVVVPEVSDGYGAAVMSGIEDYLLQQGYFYLIVSHRHREDLIEQYPRMLLSRSVEGIIAVDTPLAANLLVPVVAISGSSGTPEYPRIVLNHQHAAEIALGHLYQLGHRQIAFIKGQDFSSDTEVRWSCINAAAKKLGVHVDPELVAQLKGNSSSPELGYQATLELVHKNKPFTALFTFNDISAIGAIRALQENGRRVPHDVSVVGFDDIQSAAYQTPGLTTVRQPLREMGALAAETLLARINRADEEQPATLTVRAELIVRETTSAAPADTVQRSRNHKKP